MELLVVLAIIIGLLGVIVPILPGVLLVAVAVGGWAVANDVWWLLAAVVVLTAISLVLKFLIPARTARDAASTTALAVGAVAALVGFFVIPIIGIVVGFLAGVLVTEMVRLKDLSSAWQATWQTTKSIGITIVVELVAVIWLAGMWLTALLLI